MSRHRIIALASLMLLVPAVALGHWWSRKAAQPLPSNLCFTGRAEGETFVKTFHPASHKCAGTWSKSDRCCFRGDFAATTQQAITLSKAKVSKATLNGTKLTLCPIQVTVANHNISKSAAVSDECSYCIDFANPLQLKTYCNTWTFQGTGTARPIGGGEAVPLRVCGQITLQKNGYCLTGTAFGLRTLPPTGAKLSTRVRSKGTASTETKQYRFINIRFKAQGQTSELPCPCASTCLECIATDTTPPIITCPPEAQAQCADGTGPASTGTATATDECDPAPKITYDDDVTPGDCENRFTILRTWTATDAAGNSSTCSQTITVSDTTPPEIKCPPDANLVCPAQTDTGTATATDNCPGVTVSHSDVTSSPVIDDFTSFTATEGFAFRRIAQVGVGSNSGVPTVETGLSGVIGGSRMTTVQITAGGQPAIASIGATSGQLNYATGNVTSNVRLFYDKDGAGLAANLTSFQGFSIPLQNLDLGNAAQFSVKVTLNVGPNEASDTVTTTTPGAQELFIPPGAFAALNLANIQSIAIQFNAGPDTEFQVRTIRICLPEVIERTWKATDACGNTATCTQIITVTCPCGPPDSP